jgi:MtrB/PioB family decaheme-associated outer membrane protein
MRKMRTARFLAVALVVLTGPGFVSAQTKTETQLGGWNLEGYVEPGLRFFAEEPSDKEKGKFLEYRDINQGLFLDGLQLRMFLPDESYSVELSGRDWGLHTQEFHIVGERLGRWQAGFDWDQMRHIYSTTSQTFLKEFGGNVFILPNPRPPLGTWNSAPGWGHSDASKGTNQEGDQDGQISQQWYTGHFFFKLSPTPDLDLQAEYTRIRKEGQRPYGMAFGSPGGIFLEFVQPIAQTIHEVRLGGTLAAEQYQLQWGYTASVFVNDFAWARADNPCNPLPTPAAPCPAVGAQGQFGTTSLPPNNQAHTFNVAGGFNLPLRTRVNAGVTYSLRLQDQDFQQQTYSNSLVLTNPSLRLPEKSLHGNVQTILANVDVTSRPLPAPVTFTLKYRLEDLIDTSSTPIFSAFILNDQNTITNVPERAGRYDYLRQNADLNGRYQFGSVAALTLGVGWEGWDRNHNWEVTETDEAIAKAALDLTPTDWLLIRATYLPSFRRGNFYNTNAFIKENQNQPPGFSGSGAQNYQLRKFNEADRDRQRADLMVQITPNDQLSFTPTFSYKYDDYIASGMQHNGNTPNLEQLGLQQVVSWSAGMDIGWKPSDRLGFTLGYVHESIFQKQRQSFRNPIDPSLDWFSTSTDTIDTFHASVKATIIPKKFDFTLDGAYSQALGRVQQYSPNATGSPVYTANNPNDIAVRWPAFEDTYARIEGALHYSFAKNWSAKFFYTFERFTKSNWQTDTLTPSLPGVPAIFLGQDWKNYTAQIVGVTLRYTFE